MKKILALAFLLYPASAFADDPTVTPECVPEAGGMCLSHDQLDEVKRALQELDDIHKAPAVLTTDDSVTIIQDWDGRVYTNGGSTKPLKFKLKVGETVERDLAMTLKTQVYYRPKPPEPMFRLRIRAQAGLLLTELIQTAKGKKQRFWDAGIGWDFFQLFDVNAALYTGVNSCGGGLGYNLTKNFGVYAGYSLIYDGFKSSLLTSAFFAFN